MSRKGPGPKKLSESVSKKERKRMHAAMMKVIADDEADMAQQVTQPRVSKKTKLSSQSTLPDDVAAIVKARKAVWRRQRVLIFCSRGVTTRYRHLMNDLKTIIVNHRGDAKMEKRDQLRVINDIAEMQSCNKVLYLEIRKRKDLYLWMSNAPHGPSAKFYVVNVHTMDELKLTGNALRGSRPLIHFDADFDTLPHLKLLKPLFGQTFSTPRLHNKSKPFYDHMICFFYADNKIWFRNYQILWPSRDNTLKEHKLVEIGPRFVLIPVRIFAGSFGGKTLYQNNEYESPNDLRRHVREMAPNYDDRNARKALKAARAVKLLNTRPINPMHSNLLFKRHQEESILKTEFEKVPAANNNDDE